MSSRLAAFPAWVLDYVLVHELAHFVVPHHGPAHDELVEPATRTPSGAIGFLIAKDLDPDDARRRARRCSAHDVRP